jgi:hypothetical protein
MLHVEEACDMEWIMTLRPFLTSARAVVRPIIPLPTTRTEDAMEKTGKKTDKDRIKRVA